MKTTIHIRNMCCQRCIEAVTGELEQAGLNAVSVKLGEAMYTNPKNISDDIIANKLKKRGFELIKSEGEKISEKIKIAIRQVFVGLTGEDLDHFNLPEYLEKQTDIPYKKLAGVFSSFNKKTIESYFITHKIETVKAMIDDTDDSFTHIAFKLGYKSLSHLSRQFKSLEGISMHDYKLKRKKKRKAMDKL